MEFIIRRTSCDDSVAPCEKAYRKQGFDRINNCWFIEINSLDELLDLANSETDIIVSGDRKLEIYDDFME